MNNYPFKNVIVTGGCGFVGSNFLNYMVPRYPGTNFINIDAMNYCADERNVNVNVSSSSTYKFHNIKLQDKSTLMLILMHYQVDAVVHFAAQSHVDNSFCDPLVFTDDNIIATHMLLECCRLYDNGNWRIKKFVHISTDEVYGDSTLVDINEVKTELSHINPCNPYSGTKAAAEMIVKSYIMTYKMPAIIIRPNNIYGRNQYPEKLIPKFIKQLLNNNKCTIHGDGRYLRSFIHTHDVCTALELLMVDGEMGEIYNIGSQDEHSVSAVAKMLVIRLKGSDNYLEHVEYVSDRIFNDTRYLISSDKLQQLGWRQTVNFDDGITDTIEYYRST